MHEELPSFNEFRRALTDEELRAFQIIQVTLAMGVLVFMAIVTGMYVTTAPPASASTNPILPMLTWVMLGMAGICLPLTRDRIESLYREKVLSRRRS